MTVFKEYRIFWTQNPIFARVSKSFAGFENLQCGSYTKRRKTLSMVSIA
jgi:hypothetical protein